MNKKFFAMKKKGVALIALAALSLAILLSQPSSASLTFQGRACNDNNICDVIRACNADGCTSSFENCQTCPSTTKTCSNSPLQVPGICVDSGTPQCRDASASAACPSGPPSGANPGEPFTTLAFTVFTKKNLVITVTPETQTALAGRTLNYKASLENKNPKQLSFQITSQIPDNWQINIPATVSVSANSRAEVSFRVTSNETSSDADYPILIGMFNSELNLFGTATATYTVASRGSPSISSTPRSQAGYPGQSLFYNISVTNNDPADFDASTITLRAAVPEGFNAVFTPSSVRLQPQETMHVRLDITSPSNATENTYPIRINSTANKLTAVEFIEYEIDFCGDNVCQPGEENSCGRDCPSDINFFCNGRCERELDDGLAFSSTVSIPYNKFVICNRNASLSSCMGAAGVTTGSLPGLGANTSNCGIGKACLCSSLQSGCNTLCVDAKGVYYLAVAGDSPARGLVNWSYACPFVNLPEIKALRESFAKARDEYEKAQSALKESASNMTAQKKSEGRPCVDALSTIISSTNDYVKYLDAVIAWPGKMNTTSARERAAALRRSIEATYNTYCRGASGLLNVESITAAVAEKGVPGQVVVAAKNIGNMPYFGYVQCDFTGAAGEKLQQNSSCTSIGGQQTVSAAFDIAATSAGRWNARCRTLGSLISSCSVSAVHDEKIAQFNVSTRETFVVDVSGSCAGHSLTCSVRGSQSDCVGCKAISECTKISTANGTSTFNCQRTSYGNVTLFGYTLNNDRCKPTAPAEKNISVRCSGCGDGVVDSGEQCETPYSNNNQRCTQAQSTCEGRLFGIRDATGFCNIECSCSADQYEFSCTRGQCGAECGDGETRTVTLNATTGVCSCVQQCGSECTWNACSCEAGAVPASTGPLSVNALHSPQNPTDGTVTITAQASGATIIEIYVDGFVVKTCQSSPCILTATYTPGSHSYFARASNPTASVTDPTQGSKLFAVPGAQINGTGLGTTSIIIDVGHSPQNPASSDSVTLTATAHGPRSFREVNIFADGTLKKTCTNLPSSQPCTFRSTFTEGSHTYFATALDIANSSGRDPQSGSKSFSVSGATPSAPEPAPGGPFIGSGSGATTTTSGLGRCFSKIIDRNCTYNPATRRYDLRLSAIWDNGTHAHWTIDGNQGPKMYQKNFTHTEPLSGPGAKTVKLEVHNVNDSLLCMDSSEIYCGPGSASGKDIDIIIDVKDVVKTGLIDVRIIAAAYTDITPLRLMSYTEAALTVSNVRIEGNISLASISGPVRVTEDKSYSVYTASTSLAAGKNVSLLYKLRIDNAGEYKLIAAANYSNSSRVVKTIKATSCPQAFSVLAAGPSGACLSFTTPCDVPAGWSQVERCPDELPEQEEGSILPLVILIIIIVVLAALIYKKREAIREKLGNLRSRKSGEELPRFE